MTNQNYFILFQNKLKIIIYSKIIWKYTNGYCKDKVK